MTSEQRDKIRAARLLVVDGQTDAAIDALTVAVAGSDDWADILLLLKTRHKNLNRAILKGTIARDDENLERNGINSALFDLVQAVEHEPEPRPKPEPHPAKKTPPVERPTAAPLPPAPEPRSQPTPKPVFGWQMAAGLSVAAVVVLLFFGKNWFLKTGNDGPPAIETAAPAAPKTTKFTGKTLWPNRQPAPGIQMEIADGLAKTVSGADGSFEFSLPEIPENKVRLVLRRNGMVVMDEKLWLNPAVFAEIKVPN